MYVFSNLNSLGFVDLCEGNNFEQFWKFGAKDSFEEAKI